MYEHPIGECAGYADETLVSDSFWVTHFPGPPRILANGSAPYLPFGSVEGRTKKNIKLYAVPVASDFTRPIGLEGSQISNGGMDPFSLGFRAPQRPGNGSIVRSESDVCGS